jgi:hypothetical protein
MEKYTHDDFVRMDAEGGVKMIFSPDIEREITERHSRERPNEKIVWLIWKYDVDGDYTHVPQLHCIATSEYSCRYHLGCLVEQQTNSDVEKIGSERWLTKDRQRFNVERAPCDHSFGSTMLTKTQHEMIMTKPITVVAARKFEFGGED